MLQRRSTLAWQFTKASRRYQTVCQPAAIALYLLRFIFEKSWSGLELVVANGKIKFKTVYGGRIPGFFSCLKSSNFVFLLLLFRYLPRVNYCIIWVGYDNQHKTNALYSKSFHVARLPQKSKKSRELARSLTKLLLCQKFM